MYMYYDSDDDALTDYDFLHLHRQPPPAQLDKTVKLNTLPSHADPDYERGQIVSVFGRDAKRKYKVHRIWYDLLWTDNPARCEQATEQANQTDARHGSCLWWEAWLGARMGKPVEIVHIAACVNVATGYPTHCMDFRYIK